MIDAEEEEEGDENRICLQRYTAQARHISHASTSKTLSFMIPLCSRNHHIIQKQHSTKCP